MESLSEKECVDTDTKDNIFYSAIKRIMDIVLSSLGIIVLSPLLLIVAIAIKLESRGPIVFVQERVGMKGKRFKMYKFRSMVPDAEEMKKNLEKCNEMSGPMFKMKEDPRVTRIGRFIRKTSIDELPQFLNVIKGEMSIVGPRPSLPKEVDQFEPWMLERLEVKPGITCIWQVSGRNDVSFKKWMEMDINYVHRKSIALDIKLILKTFLLLFGDKHAR
ncbi:sugar transferase [Inconstantimicrobium mannanitabidum]|uniref:Multidrug MFS transporter n=1 Tax=Inconstantimicrobium mannanitabidum TaxID=1604901 RepID=A0ACB5REA4_9CLOT|nr:sugar transferase [Clostridium sp. TW13]GKX67445.1 multidrug MFS transporter [Clostridium sp. TW13]